MVELEAKLLVPDEATFEALRTATAIDRLRVLSKASRLQQDTYVDTREWHIYRAGYACRLRHVGHRAFVTLKGLGGAQGALHEREEIELEIDNPSIGCVLRLDETPGQMVRRLTRGERVGRLFTVVTRRRLWDVVDGRRPCFEMALDRACFFGPKGETEVLELELESLDGDRALLEKTASSLRRRYGLTESVLSKFDRGLRWAGISVCGGSGDAEGQGC